MRERCNHCSEEASYFDVNLQSWVCKNCYEKLYQTIDMDKLLKDEIYKDQIDNIMKSIENFNMNVQQSEFQAIDERFNRTAYSKSLEKILNTLNKDELQKIAGDLESISNYNEKELVSFILSNYEEIQLKRLQYLDERTYKILKGYCKNNGETNYQSISDKEAECLDYFISKGIIFPTKDSYGVHTFVIPTETLNIINKLNDFKYRAMFRKNSKFVSIYVGYIRAYGVLEQDKLVSLVSELVNENDIDYLNGLIKEASIYNRIFKADQGILCVYKISRYDKLLNHINANEKYRDYRVFTESELISLGRYNWETTNIYAKEFKRRFLKYFVMTDNEADELLEVLYDIIQEKNLEKALEEVKNMIQEDEGKGIGIDIIKEYFIKIPIWLNKGRSIEDIRKGI